MLMKFNFIKVCLQCVINKIMLVLDVFLLEVEFVIVFLNVMCVELMEMVIFFSKYFGFEDVVKERVRRSIYIIKNIILYFVSY